MTAGERNQNMAQELTVVVTGSTGKQGGAVARGLLERGHKVRAVTRDPNSSQAKDAETRQGVAAADAAKAAGVHLVFTSVGSANRRTGVPHFDSEAPGAGRASAPPPAGWRGSAALKEKPRLAPGR